MNYRHAFHAGNFADVHKHAVFARIVTHLREKAAAFRILDTHAGAGLYDLGSEEAGRTGEWREGVGRLMVAALPASVGTLLAPYLDAVGTGQQDGRPPVYPGSPALALALMRPQDRLIACETEPIAARALAAALACDRRAKAIAIDGWTALPAYIPPKERRGLVLIDPPFEEPDEFERFPGRIVAAHRKWPTGIFLVWHPIKTRAGPEELTRRLACSGIPKILRSELLVAPPADPARLNGSGLIVVNPPWRLFDELQILLPALAGLLAREGPGEARLSWLAGAP